MAKMTTATVLGLILIGAVGIARGGNDQPFFGPGMHDGLRNLVLYALGTGSPGPGQVRVPVPAEGTIYEVIVAKPGEPRSVPLAKNAD